MLFFTWKWKSGCPRGVFCPSPSPPNTYSYDGKENLDLTRKFVRNYLKWCTKYLNTSTTIRKILVPKKLLSHVRKYVKPKPISCQNQKLTQQHNWKKKFLQPTQSKCFRIFLVNGCFWQANTWYRVFLSQIERYIQPVILILQTDRMVVTNSMFSIRKTLDLGG